MNHIVNGDGVISVIGTFLDCNEGDEATEQLIINIGCELLDISQDKLIELVSSQ